MQPKTSFEQAPPKGRIIWVVYYGHRSDRRRKFADNLKEARQIAADAIKGPHVYPEHPTTWPVVIWHERAKVRPWVDGKRYIANGIETIYERP